MFDDCFDDDDESPSMLLKEVPVLLRRALTTTPDNDVSPPRNTHSSAKVEVKRQHKPVSHSLRYDHITSDCWLDLFIFGDFHSPSPTK